MYWDRDREVFVNKMMRCHLCAKIECVYVQHPWSGMRQGSMGAWRALFLPDQEGAGDDAG